MSLLNDRDRYADGVGAMMAAVVSELDAAQAEWQAAADQAEDRCFTLRRAGAEDTASAYAASRQSIQASESVGHIRNLAERAARLLRDIQDAEHVPVTLAPAPGRVMQMLGQQVVA